MNLQQAKSKAKYLTLLTKISHAVCLTNKEYHIQQTEHWKGKTIEIYNYEDISEDKQIQNKAVPDMQDIASKEILPSDRNGRSKAPSKKRQSS